MNGRPPQTGFLALTLALAALWAAPVRAEDPPAGGDPGDKETRKFGDLARQVIIYLSGKPFLMTEDQIDRVVGDPWHLNPETSAKIAALPPRFRLQIYSFMASRMHTVEVMQGEGPVGEMRPTVWRIPMGEDQGKELVESVKGWLGGHFRTEELIDLGVFYLSKLSFFPDSESGWDRWKTNIVQNDLWVGLAVLAIATATDHGNIKASGWLVKLAGDRWRLGWYGSVEGLGIHLGGKARAGIKATSRGADISTGYLEDFDPGDGAPRRAIEASIAEHFLERVGKPSRWELALKASGRYVIAREGESDEGPFSTSVNAYARKTEFMSREGLSIMAGAGLSTDYEGTGAGSLTITVEDLTLDLAGTLQGKYSRSGKTGERSWTGGFMVGGTLESRIKMLRDRIGIVAGMVESDLRAIARTKERLAQVGETLESFGTGDLSAQAEGEAMESMRVSLDWLDREQANLCRHLAEYRSTREEWLAARRTDGDAAIRFQGPLDSSQLRDAALEGDCPTR